MTWRKYKTQAVNHLFMTNEKCDTLSEEKAPLLWTRQDSNSSCIPIYESQEAR